ncbi:lipoteichoic acid biosynthesis MFS flippase LtaA [Staphylococcus massiliensis]|uniref:Putative glycolipid permease LtaA (Lipoteichoic acid protein A) n=1 Tax=Staphylococcus massiliensis S46 TaxID=1229783 RepID=K9AQ11_9STAP|nr:MFS transporter [Staphylococcus massiliensis]EKU48111.1 putative glycolipid permease LtaA (Lipoteichoic acid protein A) [Staphylococcus massiliensis S46]MCG3399843.1 MFS transporter [Staphylococcus massiliensis]MCG3401580.1 MFS transporter [Staphylococcus massiliensis]PNZ98214.1 MFS transporter [Staphylococcus massiliensis CCUG 55927]
MPKSYSSNSGNKILNRNFVILLIILFLMELARGMYVLSYLSLLPNYAKISIGLTATAISLHFIADAITNFVIGFILKRVGPKWVLTIGFALAFLSLFLVIWFPTSPVVLIISALILGIAVSPIWVIMLASVNEESRGKQMGYVYFGWLAGLMIGMISMNLLFKVKPLGFNFLMPLCVLISWVLYYFVTVKLTDYNTKKVGEQLKQIFEVTKRHLILFPGIVLQGVAISALIPILPKYAKEVMKVSTLEYTLALIIGGIGCTFSMLVLSKIIDNNSRKFMYLVIFIGFLIYGSSILSLSFLSNVIIAGILALFIGLVYGFLLPAWNTFMASFILSHEQEETWGVFNSLQGIGAMIGPMVGGWITEFTHNVMFAFYFAGFTILFLAVFYGSYFMKQIWGSKEAS